MVAFELYRTPTSSKAAAGADPFEQLPIYGNDRHIVGLGARTSS
jgi:hypothetical protein